MIVSDADYNCKISSQFLPKTLIILVEIKNGIKLFKNLELSALGV